MPTKTKKKQAKPGNSYVQVRPLDGTRTAQAQQGWMSEAGSWLILRVIRPYSGGVWTLGYLLIADTKDSNLDLFWIRQRILHCKSVRPGAAGCQQNTRPDVDQDAPCRYFGANWTTEIDLGYPKYHR